MNTVIGIIVFVVVIGGWLATRWHDRRAERARLLATTPDEQAELRGVEDGSPSASLGRFWSPPLMGNHSEDVSGRTRRRP